MDRRTFNKSIAATYGLVAFPQLIEENKQPAQPTLKNFNIKLSYGYEFNAPDIDMVLTYGDIELEFYVYSVEYKFPNVEPLIESSLGKNRIYYTLLSIDFYLDGMKIDPLDINDKETKYEVVLNITEDITKRKCAVLLHEVVLKERRQLC
jgi:hypothetical protein